MAPVWTKNYTWNDKDLAWQYGNSGSCAGPIADQPGAVIDSIRFSSKGFNVLFPWYLDHVEIHRVKYCEDPEPLRIPIESDATFLEMNPDFAIGSVLPSSESTGLTRPQSYRSIVSISGEDSPKNWFEYRGRDGWYSPSARSVETQSESKSMRVSKSRSSLAGFDDALEGSEISAPPTTEDILTWELWPALKIAAPASVRFITNYHKKHILSPELVSMLPEHTLKWRYDPPEG
ncbi:hypothetical protein TWF281_011631 [Arthrobotrys megalospora]